MRIRASQRNEEESVRRGACLVEKLQEPLHLLAIVGKEVVRRVRLDVLAKQLLPCVCARARVCVRVRVCESSSCPVPAPAPVDASSSTTQRKPRREAI